jgi:DNA modification methylase
MSRREVIGDCTLILGDCSEMPPHDVGAVVTDPPYGIGMDGGEIGKAVYEKKDWDGQAADIGGILALSVPTIIWGGNYFPLPPSGRWLVWDKKNDPTTFADCELAWTNIPGAVRVFRWLWSGSYQQKREERFHPTQKPLALMEWCLGFIPPDLTVFDGFMGSGTTGVAAARLGRKFVGVEIDPGYFEIACERVRKAYDQPDLFIDRPAPLVQQDLGI